MCVCVCVCGERESVSVCLQAHTHTHTTPLLPHAPLPQAAFALRKMELNKAKKYLEDVLAHKRAIPFRRYSGNVGRTGQAKNEGAPAGQARWPAKSAEFLLNLLKNAESNAEVRVGWDGMGWVCQMQAHTRAQPVCCHCTLGERLWLCVCVQHQQQ